MFSFLSNSMALRAWQMGNTHIEVAICDLTKESVDAIVNAANERLKHGGGVAWAIVKTGGYEIQRESDEYVDKHGPVSTGEAIVTSGGKLNAKYVIHAVGPVWMGGNYGEDTLLFNAVYNSLLRAHELNLKSVAMPAISTGIFRFPKDRAAKIFGRAIRKFLEEHKDTMLQLIRICHIDRKNGEIFAENMEL